jgi:PKD repeat protein
MNKITDYITRAHSIILEQLKKVYGGPVRPSAPIANFTYEAGELNAVYTDASTGDTATAWSWDFGVGATPATATTQGPHEVTYSSGGNKLVSLTVSNDGGSSSHQETVTIETGVIDVEQVYDSVYSVQSLLLFDGELFGSDYDGRLLRYNGTASDWDIVAAPSAHGTNISKIVEFSGAIWGVTGYGEWVRWNGTNAWDAMAWPGWAHGCGVMCVHDGVLYAGSGAIGTAGDRHTIYKWNGTSVVAVTTELMGDSLVGLVSLSGELYAIGASGAIWSINTITGEETIVVSTYGGNPTSQVIIDNRVYVINGQTGELCSFAHGETVWTVEADLGVLGSGDYYCLNHDGTRFVYTRKTGVYIYETVAVLRCNPMGTTETANTAIIWGDYLYFSTWGTDLLRGLL